jgi:hypothetical protein
MSIYKVSGAYEDLEVFEDRLTITPRGVGGFMTKGLKGTKTIPFRSITAVQHRKTSAIFSGYLQFTLPGGIESRGGWFSAVSDENTFNYVGGVDEDALIEEVKTYIERRIQELRDEDRGGPGTRSAGIMADELTKLAKLRDQGVLTEDEFAKAKQRLLGA